MCTKNTIYLIPFCIIWPSKVLGKNSRFKTGQTGVNSSSACMHAKLLQSDSLRSYGLYPTGPSVHWILQARIPELVAMPFSRGSF